MRYMAQRGVKDTLPSETPAWQWLEQAFADVCRRFDFGEIRIPTFEQTDLFQRGVGDSTDIVQKEMYTFDDKGGRSITLRPEGTAGVVRSYLEHGMGSCRRRLSFTTLFQLSATEATERPLPRVSPVRLRGLRSGGAQADAGLIDLLHQFFHEIGLGR